MLRIGFLDAFNMKNFYYLFFNGNSDGMKIPHKTPICGSLISCLIINSLHFNYNLIIILILEWNAVWIPIWISIKRKYYNFVFWIPIWISEFFLSHSVMKQNWNGHIKRDNIMNKERQSSCWLWNNNDCINNCVNNTRDCCHFKQELSRRNCWIC